MLITMEHIRAGGGIDSTTLLATGDALAIRVVELAQLQAQKEEK